jgi:hypothetical protein
MNNNLNINKIVFQALIQFSTPNEAQAAKSALEGQNIYSGCCTLRIQYSQLPQLQIKANNDRTRDFTQPNLPSSSSNHNGNNHNNFDQQQQPVPAPSQQTTPAPQQQQQQQQHHFQPQQHYQPQQNQPHFPPQFGFAPNFQGVSLLFLLYFFFLFNHYCLFKIIANDE